MHFVFNHEKIENNDVQNTFEFSKPLPNSFSKIYFCWPFCKYYLKKLIYRDLITNVFHFKAFGMINLQV